uniref:ubiquitin carboxyl-terminal hydrolase 47-like n=1 Tax=Epinephelus lanceolatus TaxID=310571 RepID=UPI0014474815|nr:ubiquitin carboxyl-terminal hydrolase 47-like [Epinephelus lanceolatus]
MFSFRKRALDDVEAGAAEEKKLKVIRPQRLPHGLYNQGATCYLNSVLQVLFMTTEIHDRLDPKSQITDEELRNLFEELKKATCGTEKITEILAIENVHEQRDAVECLELILHEVSPQASEVFEGQLAYTTKCSDGHNINEETNPFWTLPLSLKDTHDDTTYSVENGFKRIFQLKSFSGDNMVYCNECEKKTDATCGCEMVTYPQILILLLKRFDFDYSTMSYFKTNRCVDVPRTLQRKNNKYELYGMVNHMGGLRGGHYTATILSNEDKTWYEFNDDHVSQTGCDAEWPFEEVCKMALLTPEERDYFESKIFSNTGESYLDVKVCPGCQSRVMRTDLHDLSVQCPVCTARRRRAYLFCWQCLKKWKGPAPRSDRCGNADCQDPLEILRNCPDITFKDVEGVTGCPSIRACPTCGVLVEHNRTYCKNIYCVRCKVEFCFVCLKLTKECADVKNASSYFELCPSGVAPRQTSIPVWQRT